MSLRELAAETRRKGRGRQGRSLRRNRRKGFRAERQLVKKLRRWGSTLSGCRCERQVKSGYRTCLR